MKPIARRYRNGRLKNLRPFKLDADGMPARMRNFKPPQRLAPPPPRGYLAALLRRAVSTRRQSDH